MHYNLHDFAQSLPWIMLILCVMGGPIIMVLSRVGENE